MLKRAIFALAVTFSVAAASLFSGGYAIAQVGANEALFDGPTVHTVTNCNETGAGSLRAAVEGTSGKRRVEFSVACDLTLASPVTVNNGDLWIRFETAPAPGWTIRGHRLEIKKAIVKVSHVRMRTGVGPSPSLQDSIAITGATPPGPDNCAGQRDMGHIILDHVSATWSQDENVQLWGCNIHNITISNSIIAEGLKSSGHPDGDHSMGLIVGRGARDVLVWRTLFISNQWRNPVLHGDTTSAVINSWVHNAANQGIHVYPDSTFTGPTKAAIIANLITAGPSSQNRQRFGNGSTPTVNAGSEFYLQGNLQEGNISTLNIQDTVGATMVGTSPVTLPPGLTVLSAYSVEATLVNCADPAASDVGPLHKDATDLRLIAEACSRSGSLKNAPVVE
jgi:hypothetical protein